jgi:hypothetical protein
LIKNFLIDLYLFYLAVANGEIDEYEQTIVRDFDFSKEFKEISLEYTKNIKHLYTDLDPIKVKKEYKDQMIPASIGIFATTASYTATHVGNAECATIISCVCACKIIWNMWKNSKIKNAPDTYDYTDNKLFDHEYKRLSDEYVSNVLKSDVFSNNEKWFVVDKITYENDQDE